MSESGRLSNQMARMRSQDCVSAIQKARSIYGTTCIDAACVTPMYKSSVPLESDYLLTKICLPPVIGSVCGLSSRLTQQRMQQVIDESISSLDPLRRFAQFNLPPIPPVCPAIPTEILNANLPKASLVCPVPNRPLMGTT